MVRLKVCKFRRKWKIPGIIWDSYCVLCQTRVVLNHERLFQIRIWCAKSEWAVPSKKLQSVNLSKVKSVFKIREEVQNQNREFQNSIECFKSKQDIPNQDRLFQIRIWCAKSEWAVPALEHRSKKLQSVNCSKVKSVFKIREEVQNQNREFQNSIDCIKSKQDIPNQDRMFQIRIGYSKCKIW